MQPYTDPKSAPPVVIYTKQDAAKTQLETAIALWFNYGDPLSIHTLVSAANSLYHGMGSKVGKPTIIETWKKSLSNKDRAMVNEARNFAKHANKDPKAKLRLITEYAELLILDSLVCHAKMFHNKTPLMSCFFARFTFENPRLLDHVIAPERRE
jgi:hypothetical protein